MKPYTRMVPQFYDLNEPFAKKVSGFGEMRQKAYPPTPGSAILPGSLAPETEGISGIPPAL